MADIIVTFGGANRKIGLIVRGKQGPDHHPDKLEQHADCILPDGAPIGYYGEGADRSGNGVGMNMKGVVYDFNLLSLNRPWYVDIDAAIANRVVSTVLLIDVDPATAAVFTKCWRDMLTKPDDFSIVGNNCSTHASRAFIVSGLVGGGIPWLDTPDNLYGQLVDKVAASKRTSYTGFIGFDRVPDGFILKLRPFALSAQVNSPNPGRTGSLASLANAA